ncbi:MAG: Eco57I restriction-modification methylase domain-containing protein [Methylophilus sp.]
MLRTKHKGDFYTPEVLSKWMVFYLSKYFVSQINVLEPSCGNGVFIESLNDSTISIGQIDVIDLDKVAISNIKSTCNIPIINKFNEDFLYWEAKREYDLVIGNPPYIVRKRLRIDQAKICKDIHKKHKLAEYEVANIWTSFLLKSTDFLKSDGVLAFVLPTEILQVKYAKEIRTFLANNYARIELITFKHLAFDGIEQDTVVLFAYKICANKDHGVFITEIDEVGKLADTIPQFTHLPTSSLDQKWTTGILSEEDIVLVETLSTRIKKTNDYCDSVAGIVTAATNFFIVNQETVNKYELESFCKNIIQRGFLVNGCVDFSSERFSELRTKNTPCFLLDTNYKDNFPDGLKTYLAKGKLLRIPSRYKCKLRKRWHDVPGIKKGQGFFFKRSHDYPKCVKNSADVYVTDSAYQILMKDPYTIENFIFSFYNSLTLLAAEMQGRYYGGGVLELTPNEFKELPIPYRECEDFDNFSKKFENKSNLDKILESNDRILLSQGLGMSEEDVKKIQVSYNKMKSRRLRGK